MGHTKILPGSSSYALWPVAAWPQWPVASVARFYLCFACVCTVSCDDEKRRKKSHTQSGKNMAVFAVARHDITYCILDSSG